MKPKPTSFFSPCESPAQDTTGKIKPVPIGKRIPLNTAVGDRDLCAWQPVRGIVWVQTRNPNHARRLAKRSDGKLVAWGVAGGYLKTYEFTRSITWAIDLMARYTAVETTAKPARMWSRPVLMCWRGWPLSAQNRTDRQEWGKGVVFSLDDYLSDGDTKLIQDRDGQA